MEYGHQLFDSWRVATVATGWSRRTAVRFRVITDRRYPRGFPHSGWLFRGFTRTCWSSVFFQALDRRQRVFIGVPTAAGRMRRQTGRDDTSDQRRRSARTRRHRNRRQILHIVQRFLRASAHFQTRQAIVFHLQQIDIGQYAGRFFDRWYQQLWLWLLLVLLLLLLLFLWDKCYVSLLTGRRLH